MRASGDKTLSWDIRVSLLTTPIVLRQTLGVFALTFVLISAFVCALFTWEGNWPGLLASLGVVALVHLGLVALSLLTMLFYFGNRIAMHFSVDQRGATSQVRDVRSQKAAKLAVILGLATGNFGAAGAGMLATTGASSFVSWSRIDSLRFDDRRRTVYLRRGWRNLAALFCDEANYPAVKAFALALRK